MYTRVNKEKTMIDKFFGKIIQIIPAPVGMVAVYATEDGEEDMRAPIVAICLTDAGEVHPLEMGSDGLFEVAGDANNFLRIECPAK